MLELAVVQVSAAGEIEDEWSTLINPGRDVANSHIHGITATDVVRAPRFSDVAPAVVEALTDRVIVAHNAPFDLRFLEAELQRAGAGPAPLPLRGLCTMKWSTVFLDTPSRRLADCCTSCGIELSGAHSAIGDAHATAELLGYYQSLLEGAQRLPWQEEFATAGAVAWPTGLTRTTARLLERAAARAQRPDTWLDGILSRMPRTTDARVDSYLATLERALFDGVLAEHEKDDLVAVARDSGLSRGAVLDLHASYLLAMAEVAVADGIVTADERSDLDRVAASLGLREVDVDAALQDAQQSADTGSLGAAAHIGNAGISLSPGDRIVLTGSMRRDRATWEALARERGLVPGGVTKSTALVVAADPNSASGKAAKARALGIPIVTEEAFARILGVDG
ncbi:hypothetical protein GCM10027268_09610 [Brachybacterium huguangmaarense]